LFFIQQKDQKENAKALKQFILKKLTKHLENIDG